MLLSSYYCHNYRLNNLCYFIFVQDSSVEIGESDVSTYNGVTNPDYNTNPEDERICQSTVSDNTNLERSNRSVKYNAV